MEPRNMTVKRKKILQTLLAGSANNLLACLSSEYSEGNEKEFKANRGFSSKEAIEAIETLKYIVR